MEVKVVEHKIEPTPPPKTYDVWFRGLTLDEFVILRCALSDSAVWRGKVKDKHVKPIKGAFNRAYPSYLKLLAHHMSRVLGDE